MEKVKKEEEKVADPSVDQEPDLRLTMKEWVILWKTRYEATLSKVQQAAAFIDQLKVQLRKQVEENRSLRDELKKMNDQYAAEVRARQSKEGAPEPKELTAKDFDYKPKFKRKAK